MGETEKGNESNEVADSVETREALLGHHKRRRAPIDYALLQQRGGDRSPGKLWRFIEARQLFALRLYLLLRCVALSEPWDATRPAGVWARALDKGTRGGEAAVSRAWHWLEDEQLVELGRRDRMVNVTLLAPNGSGDPYKRRNDYFTLPYSFFLEGWFTKLKLPGTAMLLVSLHWLRSKDEFALSYADAARYYGISQDTARRGFDELLDTNVLQVKQRWMKLPLVGPGGGQVSHYRWSDEFGALVRAAAPRPDESDAGPGAEEEA